MAITQRCYGRDSDFDTVSDFLVRHYLPMNQDGNLLQPIWEYSYTHPYTDRSLLNKIGIWEDDNEIVGVVIFETHPVDLFLNVHPKYQFLKPEMLTYAENHLTDLYKKGNRFFRIYVNEFDCELKKTVKLREYQRDPKHDRTMAQLKIPKPFPLIRLPEGFKLISLADDNDLRKIHHVLHRGFDHPGEPPEDELNDRKRMQSGPHFRKDLNIVVEAPTGYFVSYCGIWYDSVNHFAYVEPVATDPDYRRRGLASAAVLEGIRRCSNEGATVAYVWGTKPIYTSLGFQKIFSQNCWTKHFNDESR
jgi:predicted N-acetyltransferase YhbS